MKVEEMIVFIRKKRSCTMERGKYRIVWFWVYIHYIKKGKMYANGELVSWVRPIATKLKSKAWYHGNPMSSFYMYEFFIRQRSNCSSTIYKNTQHCASTASG